MTGYIEAEKIEEMKEAVQFVLDTAGEYIEETPLHPRGCARKAWLNQAEYWLEELDKLVPGTEYTGKLSVEIMCIALFTADYRSLLNRKGIKHDCS